MQTQTVKLTLPRKTWRQMEHEMFYGRCPNGDLMQQRREARRLLDALAQYSAEARVVENNGRQQLQIRCRRGSPVPDSLLADIKSKLERVTDYIRFTDELRCLAVRELAATGKPKVVLVEPEIYNTDLIPPEVECWSMTTAVRLKDGGVYTDVVTEIQTDDPDQLAEAAMSEVIQ